MLPRMASGRSLMRSPWLGLGRSRALFRGLRPAVPSDMRLLVLAAVIFLSLELLRLPSYWPWATAARVADFFFVSSGWRDREYEHEVIRVAEDLGALTS